MLALLRVAAKRATEANYHLSFLPQVAPWLIAYRANSAPERRIEFAERMRPLFARALPEHEALIAEAGAERYLRKEGWLKLYRTQDAFAATARERELAGQARSFVPRSRCRRDAGARAGAGAGFRQAVHWPGAASVTNPLAVTRAYAARFAALGGVVLTGDARSLRRDGANWRVDAHEGPVDASAAVVALGPWAPDLLEPLGIRLPLAVKRGYHRHFRPRGNAGLTRPVVDAELGYCVAPMEQGLRLTTGAEFAARDAPPTPVQFDRLMPAANALFPLGRGGRGGRPGWEAGRALPNSTPVIGRAPGAGRPLAGLWPRPLGPHARPRHRPADGRDDDRCHPVLRSRALRGGTVRGS